MTALTKYDAARRALAEAKTLPDVQKVRGLAAAIEALARIAGDRSLIADAVELQVNADRRLGEMLKDAKDSGEFRQGNRTRKGTESEPLTLSEVGVDKKLSSKAQRIAGIGERAYAAMLQRHREAILNGRNISFEVTMRETDLQRARAAHERKTYEGGRAEDLQALIAAGRKFGVIYADPAWLFLSRGANGDGRSASAHYTTTTLDDMKSLPIAELAAEDCVLFMWIVDWCPHDALDLIRAWGFTHKTTAFTWIKSTKANDAEFMGQGYWTRANPEVCWLATRGHPKRLNADVRQLMTAPVMEHSRKPDETYARIERLVAGPYLELFARRPRAGWVSWGNELEFRLPPIEAARSAGPEAAAEETPALEPGVDFDKDTGEFFEQDPPAEDEEETATAAAEPAAPDERPAPFRASSDDLDIPPFLRRAS